MDKYILEEKTFYTTQKETLNKESILFSVTISDFEGNKTKSISCEDFETISKIINMIEEEGDNHA